MFGGAVLLVALAAGTFAVVSGFGIGSLLTPILTLEVDTRTAVAAVSIPHFAGTALRLWLLRSRIDYRLLRSFGSTSAAGGLAGALLHTWSSSRALAVVFGVLLVFAGTTELTGWNRRWRFHGWLAWAAGAASGFFGGLVGNQGGIRAAAMLGFDVSRDRFVATATATALLVDLARMPVYVVVQADAIGAIWPLLVVATVGVVLGTFAGRRLLERIPERHFRRVVGATVAALGAATLVGQT